MRAETGEGTGVCVQKCCVTVVSETEGLNKHLDCASRDSSCCRLGTVSSYLSTGPMPLLSLFISFFFFLAQPLQNGHETET